ncbi:MAG: hypothetical protein F7C81_06725 [Desulfurococcales archaeon]|nr:hypothetical protein [Desulfurococcales archaeon]
MAELKVNVDSETLELLESLADKLASTSKDLAAYLLEAVASYSDDLVRWGLDLRVKRSNRAPSLIEELIFYGVEAWKGIVSRVLDVLHARGRFELEEIDLDPLEPSLEMEFVALEGSDLKADRLRINWSFDSVIVEAYYYLEEGEEPIYNPQVDGFDVSYLPDENAIVVAATGSSLKSIPPIHVFDKVVMG